MTHGLGSVASAACAPVCEAACNAACAACCIGLGSAAIVSDNETGSERKGKAGCDKNDGCCILCYIVGFALCLYDMKPRIRIILAWAYIVSGSIIAGVLVSRHFDTYSFPASPTDMRKVDVMSTTFCESVIVDSTLQIATFVLDYEPDITPQPVLEYDVSETASLTKGKYEYWGFYLLEKSQVEITMCGQKGDYLYVIEGDTNFKDWTENQECNTCYDWRIPLSGCDHLETRTVTAFTTNQYYFIFLNTGNGKDPPLDIIAEFHVKRTRYVLDEVSNFPCNQTFDCTVPLELSTTKYIIIDVPVVATFDINISIICNPRIYMYVLVFGVCPTIVALLVSGLILGMKKRKDSTRQRPPSEVVIVSDDRLHGVINESYGSTEPPPLYEKESL